MARQTYLDYLDSGMAGEDTNDRPGSFAAADVDEAAGALAAILDEEGADVLVTYDEHGGYGHPDHVQVHRVGMRRRRAGRHAGRLLGDDEPRHGPGPGRPGGRHRLGASGG